MNTDPPDEIGRFKDSGRMVSHAHEFTSFPTIYLAFESLKPSHLHGVT
jgi:hypothetical protein